MQSSSSRGVAAVAGQEFASHLAGGYDVDWRLLAAKLPTGKDKESRAARERLWRKADANGNGFLSLAEIDKALHDEQGFEQLFGAKPVLMRAFQSARQAVKSRDSRGDDYVEKAEFRQLLVALRQVFEVYLIFNRIDTSDDRRISLDEFKAKLPELERWGAPIEDAEAEFARIAGGAEGGAEGGGQLLFTDFCAWALERSLDLEDDDDWEPDGGDAAAPTGAECMLALRRLVRLAQYEMGRQQVAVLLTLPGVLPRVLHLLVHRWVALSLFLIWMALSLPPPRPPPLANPAWCSPPGRR